MFSNISKIVFIGGNRLNEDGPLLSFIDICKNRGIDVEVISDKERINYPSATMGTLAECLKKNGINFSSVDKLTIGTLIKYKDESTLVFCINCKWILSREMIELFPGRVFNYHNSALPEQRGAACHSWRLMQNINFTRLTIHEVSPEIDKGKVYLQEKVMFDDLVHSPAQSYSFIASRESELFSNFLDGNVKITFQDEHDSFYWPRLSTHINGFIDWSWTANEIVSFCNAFDNPFDGASTYLSNSKVHFHNVIKINESFSFHPFQAGLIYRINDSEVYIAARKGGICVKDLKADKSNKIRVGLRFVTPPEILFSALTSPT